jgi:hypothetical protein
VVVIRADIQGGGVERIVYRCGETEERSCSCISTSRGAVSGVIIGFDVFV